jgi:hypothetical protein
MHAEAKEPETASSTLADRQGSQRPTYGNPRTHRAKRARRVTQTEARRAGRLDSSPREQVSGTRQARAAPQSHKGSRPAREVEAEPKSLALAPGKTW